MASRLRSGAALALSAAFLLASALAAPATALASEALDTSERQATEESSASDEAASVAMYRYYNPYTGEHFYTDDQKECDALEAAGWVSEGIGWYAPEEGEPVYRLYNPYVSGGDHHYTTRTEERDELVAQGWLYEGIGWYSGGDTPLYRQYNPYASSGTHNYTASEAENDALVKMGWKEEGIGWYGIYSPTPIMGSSRLSAEDMADYYRAMVGEQTYPSSVYASKGAPTIDDFCRILVEEAEAEGVRADVVFMQSMKETGWLRFGGVVQVEWCNFAGLGATNSNPTDANTFPDVRTGLRAQVQHLKAYASTEPLNNDCVDVRFSLVERGCAPYLEDLNGRWAVPGDGYGEKIAQMIESAVKFSQDN